MSQSRALLDFLELLIRDGTLRTEFAANPAAAFAAHGITATSPQDVYETLVLIGDNEDLGRGFDRGANAGHLPPPPPPQYFGDGDAQGAAIHYLDNYVTSGFDDDRGPFTGSSADHAPDSGGAIRSRTRSTTSSPTPGPATDSTTAWTTVSAGPTPPTMAVSMPTESDRGSGPG